MFVLSRVADTVISVLHIPVADMSIFVLYSIGDTLQYLFSLQCGEYGSTGTNRKLNFKNSSEWQLKHGVMP